MTEKHLPIFGVGPYLISSIAFITLFSLALNYLKIIPSYTINPIKPILLFLAPYSLLLASFFGYWQ